MKTIHKHSIKSLFGALSLASILAISSSDSAHAATTILDDSFDTDYGTDAGYGVAPYTSDPERQFRVYESEIDDGWMRSTNYGGIPAPGQWFITNGSLENADNTAEDSDWTQGVPSESPVVNFWSNPLAGDTRNRMTISFDYNVGAGDTLYVHLWAVDGTSDGDGEFISNMEGNINGNVDGSGGNSAELTEYNLLDGSSAGTKGLAANAISGALTGSGTFDYTIEDIAALGMGGISNLGDIDYFYIAFAKNEGGTVGSTTSIDNLYIAVPEPSSTALLGLGLSSLLLRRRR